jgi:hypothetical protein
MFHGLDFRHHTLLQSCLHRIGLDWSIYLLLLHDRGICNLSGSLNPRTVLRGINVTHIKVRWCDWSRSEQIVEESVQWQKVLSR